MYAWLFRRLPGPLWARVLIAVAVLAGIVVVLFGWGFPAIAPYLPLDDAPVGAAAAGGEGLSPRS